MVSRCSLKTDANALHDPFKFGKLNGQQLFLLLVTPKFQKMLKTKIRKFSDENPALKSHLHLHMYVFPQINFFP
jgi:hypothetical protein